MFASTSNILALLAALAVTSQSVVAGPSVIPARAGLHSKLARRALKTKRVDDAQTSLQLDPSQIGPNLALTGQEVPAAGQVDSLTSTNNYINFCLTQKTDLTDGKQITTGSCNQTPMGRIIATDKMPVSRFTFPVNGGAIAANTGFTIKMTVVNIDAGHFTNPTTTYYNAPQTVNSNGVGVGHTHCVIEKISAFDTTDLPDPRNFAFFKGLNSAADANGQLTADVTGGLPVGFYKLTSINTASNHQPFLVAVAQHGTGDDSIYFEVSANGKPSAANIAANSAAGVDSNASASVAAATASSTASAVASASASASAAVTDTASAAATETASAASESASATGKKNAGKDAVATSASEVASSSAAAATSSAAADKGTGNKNDKSDKKDAADSAVASTAAATSSTPAKEAAATSAAASTENAKSAASSAAATSSVVSSTASASSASDASATPKSDKKGKDN